MRVIPRKESESDILNITPLIDVVFLLIVFFLVATSFERIQRELEVNLPRSEAAEKVSRDIQPIAITVSADGTVTMGREEIDLRDLPGRIKEAVKQSDEPRVFVRGDARAYHENIVAVLGACQEAGVSNVSIATEEE